MLFINVLYCIIAQVCQLHFDGRQFIYLIEWNFAFDLKYIFIYKVINIENFLKVARIQNAAIKYSPKTKIQFNPTNMSQKH